MYCIYKLLYALKNLEKVNFQCFIAYISPRQFLLSFILANVLPCGIVSVILVTILQGSKHTTPNICGSWPRLWGIDSLSLWLSSSSFCVCVSPVLFLFLVFSLIYMHFATSLKNLMALIILQLGISVGLDLKSHHALRSIIFHSTCILCFTAGSC